MEQIGFHWRDFHEFFMSIFRKCYEEIQVSLISDKNNGYFIWRRVWIYVIISLTFLKWEIFCTKVAEKVKTHFFFKSCRLWGNVAKYDTARQAMDDNTEHALCVVGNKGYRDILRIGNTSCFCSATTATRTCIIVTFMRELHVFFFCLCQPFSFSLHMYGLYFFCLLFLWMSGESSMKKRQ